MSTSISYIESLNGSHITSPCSYSFVIGCITAVAGKRKASMLPKDEPKSKLLKAEEKDTVSDDTVAFTLI